MKKEILSKTQETDVKTRYTDEELAEFKGLINMKLSEARTDYEMLRAAISGTNDNGTEDTSPGFSLVEEVSGFFSREEMGQLAFRRKKYMDQLNNALIRIQNKTFGICRVTGKLIPRERLRTVPTTTLCMDAKLQAGSI